MKLITGQFAIVVVLLAVSLGVYHRVIVAPAVRVAVVDVEAVLGDQQAILAGQLIKANSEQERAEVQQRAKAVPQRMKQAMSELAAECTCQVFDRTVLVGTRPDTPDLTAQLKQKVAQ